MIWPASAISMSCVRVTGYIENATPPSASTRFTSSPVPPMPPTKKIRLLVRPSSLPRTGGSRLCVCPVQLAGPPNAAHEIDSLARAHVLDPEHGREQFVLQHAHIEPRHRVGLRVDR